MPIKQFITPKNLDELYKYGYSIIPNCLTNQKAVQLAEDASSLCSNNHDIVSTHDHWQGLYNPFYLSRNFLETIYNPFILSYVEHCLGKEANPILNMQALFNSSRVEEYRRDEIINNALLRKNHRLSNSNIHTDQLFNNPFDSKSPLQICFLIALNPFNYKTGGTAFIKSSHLLPKPRPQDIEKLALSKNDLLVPELEPGDAVVFWGHTWHLAMPNTITNERWGLSIRYTHWAIKTMFDYSDYIIPEDISNLEKSLLDSLLGKGSITPNALEERKFTVTKSTNITSENIQFLID